MRLSNEASTTGRILIDANAEGEPLKEDAGLFRGYVAPGTHLAPSKETPATFRGATLSDETNRLAGQAEFHRVDDDDAGSDIDPVTAAVMAAAGGLVLGVVVTATAFQNGDVQRWWSETAVPGVKTKWSRIMRRSGVHDGPVSELDQRRALKAKGRAAECPHCGSDACREGCAADHKAV